MGKKFIFAGDPMDGEYGGANVLTVKGHKFVKNMATEVSDDLVPFFEGHSHFMTPAEFSKLHGVEDTDAADDEGSEDNSETDYDSMTVKDLRELLTTREIEFNTSDVKAVLLEKLQEADNEQIDNEGD